MISWLKNHFQQYRTRSPWGFCWRITVEGLVVSLAIAALGKLSGLPDRNFHFPFSLPVVLFLVVIVAPVIETLLLQALPIWIARRFKAIFAIQLIASCALFGAAHIPEGILTFVAAGLIGGFYFAFTYAHWRETSRWTAFWTTAASHSMHNGVAMLILIASATFSPSEKMKEYSLRQLFNDPKDSATLHFNACSGGHSGCSLALYYFYDQKSGFSFAIGNETFDDQQVPVTTGLRGCMADHLISPSFVFVYNAQQCQVIYSDADRHLSIDDKNYDLSRGRVFIFRLSHGTVSIRQIQVPLDANPEKDSVTAPQFGSHLLDLIGEQLHPIPWQKMKTPNYNASSPHGNIIDGLTLRLWSEKDTYALYEPMNVWKIRGNLDSGVSSTVWYDPVERLTSDDEILHCDDVLTVTGPGMNDRVVFGSIYRQDIRMMIVSGLFEVLHGCIHQPGVYTLKWKVGKLESNELRITVTGHVQDKAETKPVGQPQAGTR